MVDYDTAAAVVQDPEADPIMLAKIAYDNPEFGANVAVNPRAYPGLKRWLAQFGDERARRTLATMGFVAAGQPSIEPTAASYQADGQASQPQTVRRQDTKAAVQKEGRVDLEPSKAREGEPHGFTAQQALDPSTDQMVLAQIAQYAPELRPCLARNPNTYPALVQWLAQLHDPAVDAALATRPR